MYYNLGVLREKEGVYKVFNQQPYGLYKAKDGWVAIGGYWASQSTLEVTHRKN
jgi:crotonobetainyl-CoA:carnitine CoA-transferase CaiB-like acyl-CoA transferase